MQDISLSTPCRYSGLDAVGFLANQSDDATLNSAVSYSCALVQNRFENSSGVLQGERDFVNEKFFGESFVEGGPCERKIRQPEPNLAGDGNPRGCVDGLRVGTNIFSCPERQSLYVQRLAIGSAS